MKKSIAGIFCILAGVLSVNLFAVPDAAAASPASCRVCAGSTTPPCDTCVSYPEAPAEQPEPGEYADPPLWTKSDLDSFVDKGCLTTEDNGNERVATSEGENYYPVDGTERGGQPGTPQCFSHSKCYDGEDDFGENIDGVCVEYRLVGEYKRCIGESNGLWHIDHCICPEERPFNRGGGVCETLLDPSECTGNEIASEPQNICVACPDGEVPDEDRLECTPEEVIITPPDEEVADPGCPDGEIIDASGNCRPLVQSDCEAGQILDADGWCRYAESDAECQQIGFAYYEDAICVEECPDPSAERFYGSCEVPVVCTANEIRDPHANVCICPESMFSSADGTCEPIVVCAAPQTLDIVTNQCIEPPTIEHSTNLTRSPSEAAPSNNVDGVTGAAAQLGVASAFAPVDVQYTPSAENRLPEYAAPAALLGALAFSSLYPDYELGSSFNYSGENSNLNWEAGMYSHFNNGSFHSYVSAIQSDNGFTIHSGTTYRSDSLLASYTTVEAKDYMNYNVQLSTPWKYSGWNISPNLSSQFHYDRDENNSSSESGAGLDLEYRF